MARNSLSLVLATILLLFPRGSLWAQDKTEGKRMYNLYCSGCHGESGKGDGPAARSLTVKPANHTDGNMMNQLSDKLLLEIISKGGSAVGKSPLMPAWGSQLKEKQVRDIISYIRGLAVPPNKPPEK